MFWPALNPGVCADLVTDPPAPSPVEAVEQRVMNTRLGHKSGVLLLYDDTGSDDKGVDKQWLFKRVCRRVLYKTLKCLN